MIEPRSLEEFAAESQRRIGHQCVVCQSEHREALERAYEKGIRPTMMSRWLRSEFGIILNPATIDNHFRRGHVWNES